MFFHNQLLKYQRHSSYGDEGRNIIINNFKDGPVAAKLLLEIWPDVNKPYIDGDLIAKTLMGDGWKCDEYRFEIDMKRFRLIHIAAYKGYNELFLILWNMRSSLDIDARITLKNIKSKERIKLYGNPYDIIARKGYHGLVSKLMDMGLEIDNEYVSYSLLGSSIETTRINQITYLLGKGVKVNYEEYYAQPIHWACFYGNIEIIKMLIKHGASLESKDSNGMYPIHYAASAGNNLVIKFLVEKGVSPHVKTHWGSNLLHLGVARSNIETIDYLTDLGIDINAKDTNGQTALHFAVRSNNPDIALKLIEKGADIEAKNNKGETPLNDCIIKGNYEMIEMLLKNGADPNAKDKIGDTPLELAGSSKIKQLLKKYGAK